MNQDTLHWITTIVDEEEPTTLAGLLTTCIKSKRCQLCCPVGLVGHRLSLHWKSFEA